MTAQTAAQHSPAELAFFGADDNTGIAAFRTASKHDAERVNTPAIDTTTGETYCDCKGATCGRQCWHMDLIAAAWLASPAMLAVRWLTDDQLARYGDKHALCVNTYRARTGRALPADMVALTAARCEWRRRKAARRAVPTALPIAA